MIVQVEEGRLRGIEHKSVLTGRNFCAFLGIPFAKPPFDDLRFRAPVPNEKWEGIREASTEGDECFQSDYLGDKLEKIGSEDCLYLNVYTPGPPSEIKKKKAVMLYIHGGGFMKNTRFNGPDFLINYDVVYVTIRYRLHVLGFLNTGTSNCSGNAGLKDQLLAIKWVKKNIANFGGDPENITIFGESAGAASVGLLMVSPLSKGLFNKAIVQSGSALVPWAIEEDPELQARKIGQLAGYQGMDLEGLVDYLRKLPGEKLSELADKCHEHAKRDIPGCCATVMFLPSVEKIKDGAILPDYPEVLMESATPVPTIIGYNDREGLLFSFSHEIGSTDLILNDLSIAVTDNFHVDESQQAILVAAIKEFYFQNEPVTRECVPQFMDLYTDLYFIKFFESIDYLIRSNHPPFIYLFSHDGKLNFFNKVSEEILGVKVPGASHADELGYLFSQTLWFAEMDDVDKKVIDQMCTLWTDFAKTGDPTSSMSHIDWKPHTNDHPGYLHIGETLKMVQKKLYEKRHNFWKNWSDKFRR